MSENPGIRLIIETTAWTSLGVCECGWRVVCLDALETLTAARWHEKRAHPGSKTVLRRLENARARDCLSAQR